MADLPIELVVGLGNPGERYERTRHNAGFMVLDRLAARLGASPWRKERRGLEAACRVGDRRVLLVKPQTYMNLSGQAVQAAAAFHRIQPAACLIVFDDLDLPLGRLRLRRDGSAGGHKGMSSVQHSLGTTAIPRLRVGIGRPPPPQEVLDFVLERFSEAEWAVIAPALDRACDVVETALTAGLDAAMRVCHAPG